MMNTKKAKGLGILTAVMLVLAGAAQAATITYNSSDNWSSQPSGPLDTVYINGAGTIVTQDVDASIGSLYINHEAVTANPTLLISHDLSMTNYIQFGISRSSVGGTVKQTAGNVTARNTFFKKGATGGLYEISGGSFTALTGNVLALPAGNTFSVVGNKPTINFSGYSSASAGTFKFTFTTNGVSTVNFALSNPDFSLLNVVIDGSGYTGGPDAFVLFQEARNITAGFDTNKITVTGFKNYTLTQTSKTLSISVIP